MHEYLMEFQRYIGFKPFRFQVVAENKEKAVELSRELYRDNANLIKESLKVVRELKPSFG